MQIFVAATANTPPMLYELLNVYYGGNSWHAFAGSGRAVDTLKNLHSGTLPGPNLAAFESTAGGMPISSGMLFFDEIIGPAEISHGFRSVFRATQPPPNPNPFSGGFVYPCHRTQTEYNSSHAMPMGARFRLKSKPDQQSPDILTKIAHSGHRDHFDRSIVITPIGPS